MEQNVHNSNVQGFLIVDIAINIMPWCYFHTICDVGFVHLEIYISAMERSTGQVIQTIV